MKWLILLCAWLLLAGHSQAQERLIKEQIADAVIAQREVVAEEFGKASKAVAGAAQTFVAGHDRRVQATRKKRFKTFRAKLKAIRQLDENKKYAEKLMKPGAPTLAAALKSNPDQFGDPAFKDALENWKYYAEWLQTAKRDDYVPSFDPRDMKVGTIGLGNIMTHSKCIQVTGKEDMLVQLYEFGRTLFWLTGMSTDGVKKDDSVNLKGKLLFVSGMKSYQNTYGQTLTVPHVRYVPTAAKRGAKE